MLDVKLQIFFIQKSRIYVDIDIKTIWIKDVWVLFLNKWINVSPQTMIFYPFKFCNPMS